MINVIIQLRRTRKGPADRKSTSIFYSTTTIDYGSRASVQLAASTSYHQPSDSVVVCWYCLQQQGEVAFEDSSSTSRRPLPGSHSSIVLLTITLLVICLRCIAHDDPACRLKEGSFGNGIHAHAYHDGSTGCRRHASSTRLKTQGS